MFGDSSTNMPKGVVHDLQLQIGRGVVPANFYILEMDKDRPLILGREFLATVGAIIYFLNNRISFQKIDKNTFYHAFPLTNSPDMKKTILDPTPRDANGEDVVIKDRKKVARCTFSEVKILVPHVMNGVST